MEACLTMIRGNVTALDLTDGKINTGILRMLSKGDSREHAQPHFGLGCKHQVVLEPYVPPLRF